MRNKILIPFFVIVGVIIISFLLFDNMESYFTELLIQVSNNQNTYISLSFSVLASDILLPIPSSFVMFMNGYVLGTFYGSTISLLSLMIGSVIGYYLGRFTSFGLRSKSDEKADNIVSNYGLLSILITRGIPVLSETICIICGYNKMKFKKYIVFNLLGYLPLCLLYAICGSVGYDKNIFIISFCCSIIIAISFWFFGRKYLLEYKVKSM